MPGVKSKAKFSNQAQRYAEWPENAEMAVTTTVRVRYAETDQMGIVYYANYLVWFEIGRVELLRSLDLAYSQLEKEHECILPVVEATCRYRAPARYDDEILIETRPAMLRGSVLKFAYRILRKADSGREHALLAEGETVHVVCDDQLHKKPLPERYAAALRELMASS
jgi:acyl-CoA thioester hydrolase